MFTYFLFVLLKIRYLFAICSSVCTLYVSTIRNTHLFFSCHFQWDLFRYAELDCWQAMLKRLYKKEVEQVVMRHEEYRQALQREFEQKQKLQDEERRLSDQALADLDELDKELAKY